MKRINIKKYIFQHKIRSTLFILKATPHGGIPDGTKKHIRRMRNKVANIRFILLSEEIPKIKETFDLVITDGVGSSLVERVKKIVKFNRLLVIYKGEIFDTKYNNGYKSIEIPLTHKNDLNRVLELQRLRKKQTLKQLGGKKAGHYVGVALVGTVLLLPSLIMAIQLGQYNPASMFSLTVNNNKSTKVQYGQTYSALSYNTGWAGYNQNMHFYMDCPGQKVWGGQGKAESKAAVNAALDGVKRILTEQAHDTDDILDSNENIQTYELRGSRIYTTDYTTPEGQPSKRDLSSDKFVDDMYKFNQNLNTEGDGLFDFVALQEQDIDCPKSGNTNQPNIINNATVEKNGTNYKWSDVYNSTFALNFSTPFIPIPLNDIQGKAVSGLSTFSKYYNAGAQRFALANIKTFPLNLFEMKRCLSANWFPIQSQTPGEEDKYFVFVNAHLAAYDSGGNIRREQLQQLNGWLQQLDDWGYYYMVAADWNQILPDTRGYEGNNALMKEQGNAFPKDQAIMGWDYEEFDSKHGNPKNPNLEKDYIKAPEYDSSKSYKTGDLVSYEFTGTPEDQEYYDDLMPNTQAASTGNNGSLTQYMQSVRKHNYQAIVDNPTEPPVLSSGFKSSQWKYSLSSDAYYKDASLNDYVRSTLLSVAYNENAEDNDYYSAQANFYTTHAIPTLRNAGEQFRNESREAIGHCYKASIDGFLVSKNIKVHQTFGFDTNFKYSDHNPVGITFEFLE